MRTIALAIVPLALSAGAAFAPTGQILPIPTPFAPQQQQAQPFYTLPLSYPPAEPQPQPQPSSGMVFCLPQGNGTFFCWD